MKAYWCKSSTYIDFNKKNDKKDIKFEVVDQVRTSIYKISMAKGYYPNWSEEVLVIKKDKSVVPWTYVISDLNGEKVVRTFQEKKRRKKQIKKSWELKKY